MALARCGARTRAGGYCGHPPTPGRKRCRYHGGRQPRGIRRGKGSLAPIQRLQALRKAYRLPWYGGRLPGWKTLKRRMEEAVAEGEKALALVPNGTLASLLDEGTRDGLQLNVETVRQVLAVVLRDGVENVDAKLLRLGNEISQMMRRDAIRVAEHMFRVQQHDARDELLRRLADGTEKA